MSRSARYTPRTTFRVTTPPAAEPVTAADVRTELKLPATEDARIARLITVARSLAEAYTGRALVTQGITFQLDTFPAPDLPWWDGVREMSIRAFTGGNPIALPRPPLASVEGVTYLSIDGTTRTMDAADYRVDTLTEPGRLILQPSQSWPNDAEAFADVRIEYTAGYGGPEDVPLAFVDAIVAHIAEVLDQPNANTTNRRIDNVSTSFAAGAGAQVALSSAGGLRPTAAGILAPYRVIQIGA